MSPRTALLPALVATVFLLAGCTGAAPQKPVAPVDAAPQPAPAAEPPQPAPVPAEPAPAPEPEPPLAPEKPPEPAPAPAVVCTPPPKPAPAERPRPVSPIPILGETEHVLLDPPGLVMDARIDTGSTGSMIDARNIREFERDGKTWVKFQLQGPADTAPQEVSRPVVRTVAVKGSATRRYVVTLRTKVGAIDQYTEFSLGDRSGQAFPIVLGRDFLRDQALVDVSRRFTVPAAKP